MAFLVSTIFYIFLSTGKFGAASLLTNEYVPEAEPESDSEQNCPQTDIAGTDPALVFDKAVECLEIYTSCDEAYRLSKNGELNVAPEYVEQYCNGPCVKETQLVLNCIDGIVKYFVFHNKATLRDVRETVDDGCSYGPKRGNFNVVEHVNVDDAIAISTTYAVYLMILAWHILF